MASETDVAPREIVSRDPATGETLGRFDCGTTADVRAAVLFARNAQPEWSQAGVRRRVQVVRRFQRLLHERKESVAELITREAGKPYVEALLT
ncbi:MAG: aldehyde dehydrogenase family protein, partial [Terriglobales bacterium]